MIIKERFAGSIRGEGGTSIGISKPPVRRVAFYHAPSKKKCSVGTEKLQTPNKLPVFRIFVEVWKWYLNEYTRSRPAFSSTNVFRNYGWGRHWACWQLIEPLAASSPLWNFFTVHLSKVLNIMIIPPKAAALSPLLRYSSSTTPWLLAVDPINIFLKMKWSVSLKIMKSCETLFASRH